MPSPIPKDPKTRQRTNRVPGASNLPPAGSTRPTGPYLDRHRKWHPMTRAWWLDVRRSSMASEFVAVDWQGLLMLAELVEAFWRDPTQALAAEIRLQRQCFGLTPIDRRRLQWEIERGEQADQKTRRRKPVPLTDDPRANLSMVKSATDD